MGVLQVYSLLSGQEATTKFNRGVSKQLPNHGRSRDDGMVIGNGLAPDIPEGIRFGPVWALMRSSQSEDS